MKSVPFPVLNPRGEHRVYVLDPNLLLVFKPRGHREPLHGHESSQKLTVLAGELRVEFARTSVMLSPNSPSLTIAGGRRHATFAAQGTWLLVHKPKHAHRAQPR